MNSSDEAWIATDEAARLGGYHIEHVRRMARESFAEQERGGEPRFMVRKWRREWMIERESFLAYLREQQNPHLP